MEKLKEFHAELLEAYENYKPDLSYAMTDEDTLEQMELISFEQPKTTKEYRRSVSRLLSFFGEWFPDQEEEAVQKELRQLLEDAKKEYDQTDILEFFESICMAIDKLTVDCGVLRDALTPALIKETAFGDLNRPLTSEETKVFESLVPTIRTVYPSVTAEDLYIKEVIREYEELNNVVLGSTDYQKAYDAVQSFISEHVAEIVTESVSSSN